MTVIYFNMSHKQSAAFSSYSGHVKQCIIVKEKVTTRYLQLRLHLVKLLRSVVVKQGHQVTRVRIQSLVILKLNDVVGCLIKKRRKERKRGRERGNFDL